MGLCSLMSSINVLINENGYILKEIIAFILSDQMLRLVLLPVCSPVVKLIFTFSTFFFLNDWLWNTYIHLKFNTKKQGGDLSVKTFFFKIPESRNFRKPHLDNNTSAIFQSNREETIFFFWTKGCTYSSILRQKSYSYWSHWTKNYC